MLLVLNDSGERWSVFLFFYKMKKCIFNFFSNKINILFYLFLILQSSLNAIENPQGFSLKNKHIYFEKQYSFYTNYFVDSYYKGKWPKQEFINSYIIRSLNVYYAKTNKKKYIDLTEEWTDKQLLNQRKMFPMNAFYMGYGRKPTEKNGEMFVADTACIAMAVLSTAIYTKNIKKQKKYLQSVIDYTDMVIKNYAKKSGGVTDGEWEKSDKEWWCSTALFSSLLYQLYGVTKEEKYKNFADKAIKWLIEFDYRKADTPKFDKYGAVTVIFYMLEAFNSGYFYNNNQYTRKKIALKVIEFIDWIEHHVDQQLIASNAWWSVKVAGLPYHIHNYIKYISSSNMYFTDLQSLEDCILEYLCRHFDPNKIQKNAFTYFSLSEKNISGATYQYLNSEKPCKFDDLRVEIINSECAVEYKILSSMKDISAAFYLYKNNKRVDTQWYSDNLRYKLDKLKLGVGKYKIRYFIINKNISNKAESKDKISDYSKSITIDERDIKRCREKRN